MRTCSSHPSRAVWLAIVAMFLSCALTSTTHAQGQQHLVSPGDDWSRNAAKYKPGDEIVLMPGGEHKPVTLTDLHGTAASPIIIRALKPDERVTFDTSDTGIILINPRHVIVRDMIVRHVGTVGIALVGTPQQPGTNVTIERVHFVETQRVEPSFHLLIEHIDDVAVRQCDFGAWRHIALECVGAHTVAIDGCTFEGEPRMKPLMAMRLRGASREVTITRCLFQHAGETCGICLGGKTEPDILESVLVRHDADVAYELHTAIVSGCVFKDQACPILLAHAHHCAIRANTIVNPIRWCFGMLSFHDPPKQLEAPDATISSAVGPCVRPVLGENLVQWNSGALTGLLLVHPSCAEVDIVIDENLWWSDDGAERRRRMIPRISDFVMPQLVDVDPLLNEDLHPMAAEAEHFGATAH